MAALSLILCGFFTVENASKIHHSLANFYFVAMLFGVVLVSSALHTIQLWLPSALYIIIALLTVETTYFAKKNKLWLTEVWNLVFSTLWALVIYLAILV